MEAGKIILAISIVLWVLASFPKKGIEEAVAQTRIELESKQLTDSEIDKKIDAVRLENSYAGMFGKSIEFLTETWVD